MGYYSLPTRLRRPIPSLHHPSAHPSIQPTHSLARLSIHPSICSVQSAQTTPASPICTARHIPHFLPYLPTYETHWQQVVYYTHTTHTIPTHKEESSDISSSTKRKSKLAIFRWPEIPSSLWWKNRERTSGMSRSTPPPIPWHSRPGLPILKRRLGQTPPPALAGSGSQASPPPPSLSPHSHGSRSSPAAAPEPPQTLYVSLPPTPHHPKLTDGPV